MNQFERKRNRPLSPLTKRAACSSLLSMEMSGLPDAAEYMEQLSTQTGKWLHWWGDKYYSWQIERKYQSLNPFADLKRPAFYLPEQYDTPPAGIVIKKRLRRLSLSPEQILLLTLLLELGLKKKELTLITFHDVNFDSRTLRIPGNKERTLSISKGLTGMLKQSLEADHRTYIYKDTNQLHLLLNPILMAAGIKRQGNAFNLFRQTFLLDAEAEYGLTKTMELTGYSQMNNIKSKVQSLKSPVVKQIEKALVRALKIHRQGGKE